MIFVLFINNIKKILMKIEDDLTYISFIQKLMNRKIKRRLKKFSWITANNKIITIRIFNSVFSMSFSFLLCCVCVRVCVIFKYFFLYKLNVSLN